MEVQDIRVLIVDDSALMRNLISRVVEQSPGLTVVGKERSVCVGKYSRVQAGYYSFRYRNACDERLAVFGRA